MMQLHQNRERNVSVLTSLWSLGMLILASGFLANSSCDALCTNISVTSLSCRNIGEIPVDMLNKNIKQLSIEASNIPKISNGVFDSCPSLNELIMEGSNIQTIEPNVFKELGSLEYLILKNNKISTINSLYLPNTLRYLDLSQNPLFFSGESPFPSGVKSITTLYSSDVGMKVIVNAHLKDLENLRVWRLMNNLLISLKLEDLLVLKHITSIDVENNNIASVHPLPEGKQITTVTFIDLGNNNLQSLNVNVFKGLPYLRELRLHDNPLVIPSTMSFLSHAKMEIILLSRVSPSRSKVLSTETFKDLPQLTTIEMIGSQVTNITGAFVNLRELRVINLQNNLVKVVEVGTFADNRMLKRIMLIGNPLIEFSTTALVNVMTRNDSTIEITNTPLACVSKCYDLEKWAPDNAVIVEDLCSSKASICELNDNCIDSEHCCKDGKCSKQGVCCTSGTAVAPNFIGLLLLVTVSIPFM